jgi:hypothetical protein
VKAKERAIDYENVGVILQSLTGDETGAMSIKAGTSKTEASEYVDRANAMSPM